MLLAKTERKIDHAPGRLSFETTGDRNWPQWDRYLAIDGEKVFHIGNICETCAFFFERLGGASESIDPAAVADRLNVGVSSLDPGFLQEIERIMPAGNYRVLLSSILPRLVSPGDHADYFAKEQVALWGTDWSIVAPHSPKTEYYRLATKRLPDRQGMFEFLIPIVPHAALDPNRVSDYEVSIKAGRSPTAVALSVLDAKRPADWDGEPDVTAHLCLAHYLIDGHHKVHAAARSRRPITLLSFLAVEQGMSTDGDLALVLACMSEDDADGALSRPNHPARE